MIVPTPPVSVTYLYLLYIGKCSSNYEKLKPLLFFPIVRPRIPKFAKSFFGFFLPKNFLQKMLPFSVKSVISVKSRDSYVYRNIPVKGIFPCICYGYLSMSPLGLVFTSTETCYERQYSYRHIPRCYSD